MSDRDEVLEFAAQLVESPNLSELRGIMARRKREREDAQLRSQTISDFKAEMAALIRSQKGRPDADLRTLREVAALEDNDFDHVLVVRRSWPLMARGLCHIAVTFDCADAVISPTPAFRVTLTEEGRALIESALAA